MFSDIGSTDGEDNCTSSKYGEDNYDLYNYHPCSPEIPVDNDVLAKISFVEVMAGVNFGEDQKNVSYIVLHIYLVWIVLLRIIHHF